MLHQLTADRCRRPKKGLKWAIDGAPCVDNRVTLLAAPERCVSRLRQPEMQLVVPTLLVMEHINMMQAGGGAMRAWDEYELAAVKAQVRQGLGFRG